MSARSTRFLPRKHSRAGKIALCFTLQSYYFFMTSTTFPRCFFRLATFNLSKRFCYIFVWGSTESVYRRYTIGIRAIYHRYTGDIPSIRIVAEPSKKAMAVKCLTTKIWLIVWSCAEKALTLQTKPYKLNKQ